MINQGSCILTSRYSFGTTDHMYGVSPNSSFSMIEIQVEEAAGVLVK